MRSGAAVPCTSVSLTEVRRWCAFPLASFFYLLLRFAQLDDDENGYIEKTELRNLVDSFNLDLDQQQVAEDQRPLLIIGERRYARASRTLLPSIATACFRWRA